MFRDKLGAKLVVGDEIIVEPFYAKFSKCKMEKGWIVTDFRDYSTVMEVIATHKETDEIAFFPLFSVTKIDQ